MFSYIQNKRNVFGAIGLTLISAVTFAANSVKVPAFSQVMGIHLALELRTVEDYDGYNSYETEATRKAPPKRVQQYFGERATQTLKITGSARFDDMTIDVNVELPKLTLPSLKAVDVLTDPYGNRSYLIRTPKTANDAFLGNDSALKAACFQHLDPSISIWHSKKRVVSAKTAYPIDVIEPDQADDVFSTAHSYQGFQVPKFRLGLDATGAKFSLAAQPSRVQCRQIESPQGRAGAKKDLLQCLVITPLDFVLAIDDRSETNLIQILASLDKIGIGKKRISGSQPMRFADVSALFKSWAQNPSSLQSFFAMNASAAHQVLSDGVAPASLTAWGTGPLAQKKAIDPSTIRREDCHQKNGPL